MQDDFTAGRNGAQGEPATGLLDVSFMKHRPANSTDLNGGFIASHALTFQGARNFPINHNPLNT